MGLVRQRHSVIGGETVPRTFPRTFPRTKGEYYDVSSFRQRSARCYRVSSRRDFPVEIFVPGKRGIVYYGERDVVIGSGNGIARIR